MFRGSVKGTGYPLHSPVSPSLPLPCVTVCHHISTGLYRLTLYSWTMHIGFNQCWNAQNTELPGKWYAAWLVVSVYGRGKAGRLRVYRSIPATDTFLSCTPTRPTLDHTLSHSANCRFLPWGQVAVTWSDTQFHLVPRLVTHGTVAPFLFLKRFIAQRVYTVCTRINYRIVPVTSLNKYWHYGTRGTEKCVHKYRCK